MNMQNIQFYCEPFLVDKGWLYKRHQTASCWKCGKRRRVERLLNVVMLTLKSAWYHYVTVCDFGHGCNTGRNTWPTSGSFVEWRGEAGPERDAIIVAFHKLKQLQKAVTTPSTARSKPASSRTARTSVAT